MPDLTLYYSDECPFCTKVLNYMHGVGIVISMKNIQQDPHLREELIAVGGKGQVPCLEIDGVALYESNDIIQWFKDNWS